jgi:hypothetical protein
MVQDVATWWNSTAELIAQAIQLCKALSLLMIDKEHNKPCGIHLKQFQLSSKEWDLLEQLHPLLDVCNHDFHCFIGLLTGIKVFLLTTKRISQNKVPLICDVIPIFDILTHTLDRFVDDETCAPVVCAAALHGLPVLNKYYALTDDSVVHRIAMST